MAPLYHYDIFAKNDDDDNDDDDCRQIPFNQSMNESINQLLKSPRTAYPPVVHRSFSISAP